MSDFYSKLNGCDITDEDYQHVRKVWKHFDVKSFREYHGLYMKLDVLLLTDVFENFRDVSMKNYELDPCWYFAAPGMVWYACLKESKIKLELFSDPDVLLMIEAGVRGSASMIPKRYAKANNKYMKNFNPDEESKFIEYLDANNLYGLSMGRNNMPFSNFRWMNSK